MNKVKYIHILVQNELKFNPRLIQMVGEETEVFNKEEHAFVTPHKKVYDAIKDNENVYFDNSGENLVNKYAPYCDWMIFHGHLNPMYGLKIKKKNYRKLIMRYWGGNLGYTMKKGQFFKNTARKLVNFIYIKKLKNIAAMGIANKVDELSLQQQIRDVYFFGMTYSLGKRHEVMDAIKDAPKSDCINVLVGHSAWGYDSHIEIIEELSKYGDKIHIYVPLSYGNEEYKATVDNYIKEKNNPNIIPIKDFMAYDEYARLLNKMDIAILNGEVSYALGNVSILLLLKKKLFLNRNGIIKKAFDAENMPCCCVDELKNMDFESFVKPLDYPENLSDNLTPYSREKAICAWKGFFERFN